MKRFFFTAIALAAVAVSCTKGGLLESPQTYEAPISFEPYTGKALATKASVVETSDIESVGFKVLGFIEEKDATTITPSKADFTFAKVYKDGGAWKYDEAAAYWPDGQDLTFVAYGLNAGATNPVDGNYAKISYEVPSAVADQKDLVISPVMQNLNSNVQDGPVSVYLYHALSRVGFTLKTQGNATSTANNVEIKSITLNGNFTTKATFDLSKIAAPATNIKTLTYYTEVDTENNITSDMINFSATQNADVSYQLFGTNGLFTTNGATPDATIAATETDPYTYNSYNIYHSKTSNGDGIVDASSSNKANRFMMIMPGQVGDVVESDNIDFDGDGVKGETITPFIKVVYQITGATEQTATIALVKDGANWTFEPGKAYEFVFTVSTVAVGFNVDVNIWDPTSTTDNETVTVPVVENLPL